jgi:hypothetical protein
MYNISRRRNTFQNVGVQNLVAALHTFSNINMFNPFDVTNAIYRLESIMYFISLLHFAEIYSVVCLCFKVL